MLHLIPAPLHRFVLRIAHWVRHRWRRWRGVPLSSCSIIVTNPAGAILMLRHSYGPDNWALPGGGIGRNELPKDAAQRELKEEVAIEVSELQLVGIIEEEISGSPHSGHLFTVTCDQVPIADYREIAEANFFPVHLLPEPMSGPARKRLDAWQHWRQQGN